MYKVFIDNKAIVFSENLKKINKIKDFVLVNTSKLHLIDLVKCRDELPGGVSLIIEVKNPEKALMDVFCDYEFVEAAGGIVKRKNTYLFIERHALWDLPKGKLEKNEKPALAAVREIEEECGIHAPVVEKLIGITYHTYLYKGVPTLKKNWWYALTYDGPELLNPQTEESITKAVWLPKNEWKQIRKNTYASIAEVLQMYEKG